MIRKTSTCFFCIFSAGLLLGFSKPATSRVLASIRQEPAIYVSASDGSDAGDGSQAHPKATIQAAITAAAEASVTEVNIAGGFYMEHSIQLHEGISLYGGWASDWSTRDPDLYPSNIEDPRTSGTTPYVLYAGPGITGNTIVDGLVLQAGSGTRPAAVLCEGSPVFHRNSILGGQATSIAYGILIRENASPELSENKISGGRSEQQAIAVSVGHDSSPVITHNTISGEDTQNGTVHAIYNIGASPLIACNILEGGSCVSSQCYSAAIRDGRASSSVIYNNIIHGGTGYRTYGIITSDGSNPSILNNSIQAGPAAHTATGIYIKNDDNPRIINNLIFTSGGQARYCIYENNPGSFPGHPNPDSNPGILRNNNFFACPTALLSWFNETSATSHSVTDLETPVTTAEDGTGALAQWGNIFEDISSDLDPALKYLGNLSAVFFDTGGVNGLTEPYPLPFEDDFDGQARTPTDSSPTGWSMGAYEYDSTLPPLEGDVNLDGSIDQADIQACLQHILMLHDYGAPADLNQDGSVNALDIQRLVQLLVR
ncbi:MAG: right-handed parallel beta-helix repeat-containing protein [Anaerolineales bacterium]|nr:right-handed parallel beta-helix repeat-containing protein [Anaerolineales bacterium]